MKIQKYLVRLQEAFRSFQEAANTANRCKYRGKCQGFFYYLKASNSPKLSNAPSTHLMNERSPHNSQIDHLIENYQKFILIEITDKFQLIAYSSKLRQVATQRRKSFNAKRG